VKSKQVAVRANALTANDNKSVPVGTVAAVREYLNKLGLGPVLRTMKRKGVPLFPLITALISYRLTENFSIDGCGRWLDPDFDRMRCKT